MKPTTLSRRALLGTGAAAALMRALPFRHGALDLPFTARALMNLPHIAIGGFAAFGGFVLARGWAPPVGARRPAGTHR